MGILAVRVLVRYTFLSRDMKSFKVSPVSNSDSSVQPTSFHAFYEIFMSEPHSVHLSHLFGRFAAFLLEHFQCEVGG